MGRITDPEVTGPLLTDWPSFNLLRIDSHSWGITPEPAPTPPVVSNVSPAPGAIASAEPVTFDVTDANGLRRVLVTAAFAGLPTEELVYDGTFRQLYAQSTTTAITDGLRFSLVRHPGWPSAPTITVYPFDTRGAEG